MPTLSQNRPALNIKMQQCANLFVATMVSQQFVADPFTTDFIVIPDKDRFQANTEGGDVIANVTIADMIEGKPYVVEKIHADNTLTVHFTDGDFEGDADIALTGDGDAFAFVVRSGVVRLAFPSGVPGAAPAGALAADQNLADLDDADAALGNLGGTAAGIAVFKAADEVAAREALGVNDVVLGPFKLSLVGADADEMRFQSPVAGTIAEVRAVQIKGPVATGAATATLTTEAGSPTTNTITHALAEAAGTKKTMTPGGANATVAVGDFIRLAITGTNDAAGSAAGYTVVITRT